MFIGSVVDGVMSTLNHPNCGDELVRSYLPTKCGDMLRAKGNSGDMVTKDKNRVNRRSEVSYNDKIWAQRLGKARHPHILKWRNVYAGGLKIR